MLSKKCNIATPATYIRNGRHRFQPSKRLEKLRERKELMMGMSQREAGGKGSSRQGS
jgi:hypothetical protein